MRVIEGEMLLLLLGVTVIVELGVILELGEALFEGLEVILGLLETEVVGV